MPTTTDADVVLGLIDPDYYLGGRMSLDPVLASVAVTRHVAEPLGIDVLEAAEGMIQINDLHMADAIRVYAARKGLDLAQSTLVPCGGAGPLHAAGVAAELGITRIIVPPQPGAFSAVGLLCSDIVQDFVQSDIMTLVPENAELLELHFGNLEEKALTELTSQGFDASAVQCVREVDTRYAGQGFEIRIALNDQAGEESILRLIDAFHEQHRRTYGHAALDEAVEVVSCRVRALVELPKYVPSPIVAPQESLRQVAFRTRQVRFRGSWYSAAVVARPELTVLDTLIGPVIVEQPDTTTFVPPGWTLSCDAYGNLDLRKIAQ